MSKLAPTSTKYVIRVSIKASGIVEKPDIIGAVFGQTEGLLGSELDLRELQRTGRIGRIDVKTKSVKGKSEGEIIIPSSLDAAETSLIAATLETIDRVGPCTAAIKLKEVEDTRSDKRRYVVDKAKSILKELATRGVPDSSEISEQIKEAVRTQELGKYHGLAAGPNLMDSEDIIIVEGRADVINLLKYGVRNAIAVEGTSVSREVVELAKTKTATLFIDGDRGGQLIAKKIMQLAPLDYIAVAPEGKEVEELTQKEIYKALREKTPADQFMGKPAPAGKEKPEPAESKAEPEKPEERPSRPERGRDYGRDRDRMRRDRPSRPMRDSRGRGPSRDSRGRGPPRERIPQTRRLGDSDRDLFKKTLGELVGTGAACIFNDKKELQGRVPVAELENTLRTMDNPHAVIFDGKVTFRLNEVAKRKGVRFLVGMEKEAFYSPLFVLSKKDLE